ncbi:MAG: AsmA family protein [Desulfobacula sp.]|nr:AsmA family protein [Desulfobacula sp.]
METFRALKVKGDVLIGELIISQARLQDVKLQFEAKNGNIKMAPMTANLYKGEYKGDIFLDATKKIPKITINADLKGIQAEPLLNDITGKAKLRGTDDFNMALTTAGHDAQAMKKRLNGKMSFSFKDGAVKGFNIGKFLRSLKAVKTNLSYKVSDKEETDFAELTGNPTVKNGVVTLNDLYSKSPAFRIQGKGLLADLVKEKIDYIASVTVVETSKGQAGKDLAQLNGITIPIQIEGSLQNSKIKPDIQGVITSFATKEITDKIEIKIPGFTSPERSLTQEQSTEQQLKSADPNEALKDKIDEEVGNFLKKLFN